MESDYADRLAERQIDRHEAEFGADGRRAFPNLNDDVNPRNSGETGTYTITDYFGAKIELALRVDLYEVEDFMGETLPGLAIVMDQVNTPDGEREQYGILTVSFGEFIGAKNAAYIDTNNNPFAEQLLQYGIAQDTGFHKNSGFCSYPLWQFNEDFLKAIGGENYKEYSDSYDKYMGMPEYSENWELVSRKEVPDADGFMTEYSWYTDGDVHIFILGDSEIYYPESANPDWECDSEEEAQEWFDNYEGFATDKEFEEVPEGLEDPFAGLSLNEESAREGKFGLTEERYNQMMKSCNNDEEWVEGIVLDWGADNCNKGYAIFNYEGTELLELCAINDVDAFKYDSEAAVEAAKEGIKIIPESELPTDMPYGMQYHQWVDTEDNRKNIFEYCQKHRERLSSNESRDGEAGAKSLEAKIHAAKEKSEAISERDEKTHDEIPKGTIGQEK